MKRDKGSIGIFVLIALLFMSGFLLILYASNVNKSKTVKEQFNTISDIYVYNGGEEGAYDKAYTDLRKKNKQTMTASSEGQENTAVLELTKTFNENLINYRIYGNSVQNGTPTPNNPVEVQSVGDLVEDTADINNGKYRISIKLTNENGGNKTTNIYLDEPLRKIGDYTDYIDFKEQKVVRNVGTLTFNGTEGWFKYNNIWAVNSIDTLTNIEGVNEMFNTHYAPSTILNSTDLYNYTTYIGFGNSKYYIRDDNYTENSEFKKFIENQYNDGTPMIVYFPITTQKEENIRIQRLLTYEDYTKIEVLTSIPPSKIEVEYTGYTLE